MKKTTLSIMALAAITTTMISCGENKTSSSEQELDSLRALVEQQQGELKAAEEFTEAVNFSMDSIVNANGIIFQNREGVTPSREKLRQNIDAYKNIINSQRDKLEELKQKLASQKGAYAAKMKEIVEKMQAQLDAKDAELAALREELNNKNADITQLNMQVNTLNKNVQDLTEETQAQQQTIQAQTDQMNEAYYIIASKSELKAKGLLAGGGLFSKKKLDMSTASADKFTKIDIRKKTTFSIPSDSPKLLTQAPSGSYTITKNSKNSSTLTITDPARFWSVSNYLVIQY